MITHPVRSSLRLQSFRYCFHTLVTRTSLRTALTPAIAAKAAPKQWPVSSKTASAQLPLPTGHMRRSLRNVPASAAAAGFANTSASGNSPAQLAVKIEDLGSLATGNDSAETKQPRKRKRQTVSKVIPDIKSECNVQQLRAVAELDHEVAAGTRMAKQKQARKRKLPTASSIKAEVKSDVHDARSAVEEQAAEGAAGLEAAQEGEQNDDAQVKVELQDGAAASEQVEADQAIAGPYTVPYPEQASKPQKKPKAKSASKAQQQAAAPSGNSSADVAVAAGPDRLSVSASQLAVAMTEAVKADPAAPVAADAAVGNAAVQQAVSLTEETAQAVKPRKPRGKKVKEVKPTLDEVVASLNLQPYRERVQPRKWVGAHVSMAGGIEKAVVHAAAIGANAFALDTRSKRQWNSAPLAVDTAAAFRQACKDFGFGPQHILPHGSYLINLASADPELYDKSYNAFLDELQRCELLGIGLYNFHPGSTCGKCSAEEGMGRIADAINRAHAVTQTVVVVLENMAGAGHSVGHTFEYLRYIIDRVHNKERVGVCLDTCHLFAGGYDVSSHTTFEKVMSDFDEKVGLKYLRGMHVNDSKAELGSKKDRHQNVAKGLIGQECFHFLMNDSRFDGMPLIMETPVQCGGPRIDYKLSFAASAAVFDLKGPSELLTGMHTDKRDIAWLNSLAKA